MVAYFSFPVHTVPSNLPQNFSHYRHSLLRNKDLKFMVKSFRLNSVASPVLVMEPCPHTHMPVRFRLAHALKRKKIIVTLNAKAALGSHGYSKISMSLLHCLTCSARCSTYFSDSCCDYLLTHLTNAATASNPHAAHIN